jgi:hypothetical protein
MQAVLHTLFCRKDRLLPSSTIVAYDLQRMHGCDLVAGQPSELWLSCGPNLHEEDVAERSI